MNSQSRILWIIWVVVALVVLGQLLAILRWVIGLVILVAVIGFVVRAIGSGVDREGHP
ncbi:MAG: hypothetical protein ACXW1Y_04260 [Acidimicrobiia bacterium]